MEPLNLYDYLWGINSVSLEVAQSYFLAVFYVILAVTLLRNKSRYLKIACIVLVCLMSFYNFYVLAKRAKADITVCQNLHRREIADFFYPDRIFINKVKGLIGNSTTIKLEFPEYKVHSSRIDALCFLAMPKSLNFWDNDINTDHKLYVTKEGLKYYFKNKLVIQDKIK